MAAGDVDITADTLLGSGLRMVVGTVTLDGGNPTIAPGDELRYNPLGGAVTDSGLKLSAVGFGDVNYTNFETITAAAYKNI